MENLVNEWFEKWAEGTFLDLPISDDFKHTSPFGTIEGKKNYLDLVEANKMKFLGYVFEIHDTIYAENSACVRYTAKQGDEFALDVSEWHYAKNGLIYEIVAYYHIGEIRDERKLEEADGS